MKFFFLSIYLFFLSACIFSQVPDKTKAFENYHKVFSTVQMAELTLLLGGMDNNHTVFIGSGDSYQRYPDAGITGYCESGIYLSSTTVKINENLIYVLSVGTVSGLENNQTKVMLSSISDGETTDLLNGIYTKERYKAGVNKYLEVIKIGRGTWGSNFLVLIRDYATLFAFSLPNVITEEGSEEPMIFQLHENFTPCSK